MSRYLRENNLPLPSETIPDWCGPVLRSWRCSICGEHHRGRCPKALAYEAAHPDEEE